MKRKARWHWNHGKKDCQLVLLGGAAVTEKNVQLTRLGNTVTTEEKKKKKTVKKPKGDAANVKKKEHSIGKRSRYWNFEKNIVHEWRFNH